VIESPQQIVGANGRCGDTGKYILFSPIGEDTLAAPAARCRTGEGQARDSQIVGCVPLGGTHPTELWVSPAPQSNGHQRGSLEANFLLSGRKHIYKTGLNSEFCENHLIVSCKIYRDIPPSGRSIRGPPAHRHTQMAISGAHQKPILYLPVEDIYTKPV
jgi:hypothetical protein